MKHTRSKNGCPHNQYHYTPAPGVWTPRFWTGTVGVEHPGTQCFSRIFPGCFATTVGGKHPRKMRETARWSETPRRSETPRESV
jgi:hypothetical protein